MKKYHTSFPVYGQCTVGNVLYWQKIGIASGITKELEILMQNEDISIDDYKVKYDGYRVTVVIPTQEKDWLNGNCPVFHYGEDFGVIDMLCFDKYELQFHIMIYDKGTYHNGHWHTVRECLSLEETAILFEYVRYRIGDLIILSPEDTNKYSATGAIGIKNPYLPTT